jgi:prepilin-type N-terminal cleavage/methylation domain-containing protein
MAPVLRGIPSLRREGCQGFTLVEILVSITILALGMVLLGSVLAKSTRTARSASSVSYQTAIIAAEANRLDAVPFAQLTAGTVCDTSTAMPLPRIRCSTVAVINPKLKQLKIRVVPTDSLRVRADSLMFERGMSGPVVPPLSTP